MSELTAATSEPHPDPRPRSRRLPIGRIVAASIVGVVLVGLPLESPPFRNEQFVGWMAIAIAASGLNLLTGYNGQISVGHGALYGIGAYSVALLITDVGVPVWIAVALAGVICFVVGVAIGLPALRIKGLYLALVTLAVATLFPLLVEQFSSVTGGGSGLSITSPQETARGVVDRPIQLTSPFGALAPDQWKYYVFLALTVVVFVVTRNIVRSRTGRSLVAVRDNETAAEVSGIHVARVKILTFGVSAAMAGVGGAVFALNNVRVNPSSFTIAVSIYFLIAVVVGGAASVIGPAIGAVAYGVFVDVVSPELPERLQPATPVILGGLLIVLMLVAPGGIVGWWRMLVAKRAARRGAGAAADGAGPASVTRKPSSRSTDARSPEA
ncbi:MAG: branched-chain amino acid ABC transporter permease [Actinobacteria bacterium]|nr:branched-chain amino acid ABC transporter permease [Actinomycetota bacterium]